MAKKLDEESCPACGTRAGEVVDGESVEFFECSRCVGIKCTRCDMGDDVPCMNCENDEGR